jgi:hypothetical protein
MASNSGRRGRVEAILAAINVGVGVGVGVGVDSKVEREVNGKGEKR